MFKLIPLALVIVMASAACTTGASHRSFDYKQLVTGKSNRDEVLSMLGTPSKRFENNSVLTYRVSSEGSKHYAVTQTARWDDVAYSLVLVFDDKGVLTEQNWVRAQN